MNNFNTKEIFKKLIRISPTINRTTYEREKKKKLFKINLGSREMIIQDKLDNLTSLSSHRGNKGGFRCLRRSVTSDKTVGASRKEKRGNLFRRGESRGGGGGEGKKRARHAVNNRRVWPTRSAARNRVFIARAPVVRRHAQHAINHRRKAEGGARVTGCRNSRDSRAF